MKIENPTIEEARTTLGKDFLGVEAVKVMEDGLRAVGVDVEFEIDERLEALRPFEAELRKLRDIGITDYTITSEEPIPAFPYTKLDLELANHGSFKEMLVLRPQAMRVRGEEVPLTLNNFANLFRKDPLGKLMDLFDRGVYHRLGASSVWYKQDYANQEGIMTPGWALVHKEPQSEIVKYEGWHQAHIDRFGTDRLGSEATTLKDLGANNVNLRRRTALEIAWDTMLYYVNTGETLLYNGLDRSSTGDENGGKVVMGYFRHNIGASGLRIQCWRADTTDSPFGPIGVCYNR